MGPRLENLGGENSEREAVRRDGKLAGILFIAGGLAGTPVIALESPDHGPAVLLLTLLAVATGIGCLLAPWERWGRRALHPVIALASIEVFTVCMLVAPMFCWYFVLVAIYAAYVLRTRAEIGVQIAFAGALMFTSAAIDGSYEVVATIVSVPTVLASAGMVTMLREELERGRARYAALARQDSLTGVGNYRALRETLTKEIAAHHFAKRRFALVLIDLNDFKRINDHYGHLEGDRVLRDVGGVIGEAVPTRFVSRHGGDEFSVVATETSEGEAAEMGSRLEQAVARVTVGDVALGACTGYAMYPDHGDTPDGLIAHADRALRKEKGARRELRSAAPEVVPAAT
jgi:diguanylate cyclase (GGDEF)-like protein